MTQHADSETNKPEVVGFRPVEGAERRIPFGPSWPLLVLVGLVLLFLADVCFGGKMLFLRDFFNFDVESRIIVGKALRSGTFRLWNAFDGFGSPLAANPLVGAFYPLNWIFAISNVELAIRIWWVLHLVIGAVSFYLLARHWRLDIAPSLCAAVTFTFSTFVIAYLEFAQAITCLVWGPLVLLLASLAVTRTAECSRTGSRELFRRNCVVVAALGATMAMQIVSSGEFFYYTALLTGSYVALRIVALKERRVRSLSLVQLAIAGAIGLALALPFLLLLHELMPLSVRAGGANGMANIDSAHPRYWLTFLVPYLYGRPGYPNAFWGPKLYEFAMGHCYLGLIPLLSMFLGMSYFNGQDRFLERRQLICFWVAVAAGALLMTMGDFTPVYPLLHDLLPGLGYLRYPTKFYLLVAYALAILGALGLQATLECRAERDTLLQQRVWKGALGCVLIVLIAFAVSAAHEPFLVWLMADPSQPSRAQIHAVEMDFLLAALVSALGLILLRFTVYQKPGARWLQTSFVCVAFVNLWIVSRQAQPTVRSGIYDPDLASVDRRLKADPLYKVWTPYWTTGQYLYGETRPDMLEWAKSVGMAAGWYSHGIYRAAPASFGPSRTERFCWLLSQTSPTLQERIADMLSIRQMISGAPADKILWGGAEKALTVTARPSALPRAFVMMGWRLAADGDLALQTILSEGFDPHQEAVIEPLPGEPAPELPAAQPGAVALAASPVTSLDDRQEFLIIDVSASRRSLLVLGDTWYPGWSVKVDNHRQPIYRANYAFRGVFLEPGKHHIEFTYRPHSLHLGVWISAATAIGCILLVGFAHRLPRQTSSQPPTGGAPVKGS